MLNLEGSRPWSQCWGVDRLILNRLVGWLVGWLCFFILMGCLVFFWCEAIWLVWQSVYTYMFFSRMKYNPIVFMLPCLHLVSLGVCPWNHRILNNCLVPSIADSSGGTHISALKARTVHFWGDLFGPWLPSFLLLSASVTKLRLFPKQVTFSTWISWPLLPTSKCSAFL